MPGVAAPSVCHDAARFRPSLLVEGVLLLVGPGARDDLERDARLQARRHEFPRLGLGCRHERADVCFSARIEGHAFGPESTGSARSASSAFQSEADQDQLDNRPDDLRGHVRAVERDQGLHAFDYKLRLLLAGLRADGFEARDEVLDRRPDPAHRGQIQLCQRGEGELQQGLHPPRHGVNRRVDLRLRTARLRSGMRSRAFSGVFWSVVLVFAVVQAPQGAYGRLGETAIECIDRYGAPKTDPATKTSEKVSPILVGAMMRTFDYQGWRIRIAYLEINGPVVRMTYQKLSAKDVNPRIQDFELEAILKSNTPPGMNWKPIAYDNPQSPNRGLTKAIEGIFGNTVGERMWRRSDGSLAWLRAHLILQLELPAARKYEARVKQMKEEKARASVPQF